MVRRCCRPLSRTAHGLVAAGSALLATESLLPPTLTLPVAMRSSIPPSGLPGPGPSATPGGFGTGEGLGGSSSGADGSGFALRIISAKVLRGITSVGSAFPFGGVIARERPMAVAAVPVAADVMGPIPPGRPNAAVARGDCGKAGGSASMSTALDGGAGATQAGGSSTKVVTFPGSHRGMPTNSMATAAAAAAASVAAGEVVASRGEVHGRGEVPTVNDVTHDLKVSTSASPALVCTSVAATLARIGFDPLACVNSMLEISGGAAGGGGTDASVGDTVEAAEAADRGVVPGLPGLLDCLFAVMAEAAARARIDTDEFGVG